MTQNTKIKTEEIQDDTNYPSYYKAYVVGKEDYYSLGKTPEEARMFLKNAIELRPDIYGGE